MTTMLARVGNPLEWSYVDKSLLIIGLGMITAGTVYLQLGEYRAEMAVLPNYAPWIVDQFRLCQALQFIFWVPLTVWGLLIRRRHPNHRGVMWTMAFFYPLGLMPAVYFAGPFIAPLWMIVLGTGVVGFLLFPVRVVLFSLGVSLAGIFAIVFATWQGWLPYASLLEAWPSDFVGHRLGLLWVGVMTANSLLFATMAFVTFVYTVNRWRRRESELVEAHASLARSQQRLSRATDLIRRYVANQVADQILSGEQVPVGVHARRTLTIFYSDIKGFTEASDQIDPEELSRVLNEYLSEMSNIAMAHGGTIDKFVGDAIMIFFGAPTAMDEKTQALNAVHMAIAMGKRMEHLRSKWYDEGMQFPFEKRVGINTGIASVGNFGSQDRLDYTIIGQQVNLAAKLESACEPGRVLISDATWALVKDEIPCTAKGVLTVSGIDRPIGTYEVAG